VSARAQRPVKPLARHLVGFAVAALVAVAVAVFAGDFGGDGPAQAVFRAQAPGSSATPAGTLSGTATGTPTGQAATTAAPSSATVPASPVATTGASPAAPTQKPGLGPAATPTRTAVPASPNATPTRTLTPKPSYTNLVGNGGFESGSLSFPWGTGIYEPRASGEVFWGSADADAVVVSDSVHGGAYALRITNRSAQAANVYRTLAQKVAVTGGQQHCLTWWARTANASNGILNFRLNDSWSLVLSIAGGLPNYTQYAGTFIAEDSNVDLRILSENTGTVWIDDIELSEGACKVPNGPITGGASPR
jgi:hypothetical protein